MDDMYVTGVFISLLMWLYHMVMIVVNANSQLARNLKRVGLRLSWLSGSPIPDGGGSSFLWIASKYVLYGLLSLLGIFLSWLSVLWFLGTLLYTYSKQIGTPQAIKEYRWKLRNLDMTREQIEAAGLALEDVPTGARMP